MVSVMNIAIQIATCLLWLFGAVSLLILALALWCYLDYLYHERKQDKVRNDQ